MNRRLAALACALLLSACSQVPTLSTHHAGADAGRVILGFGIIDFDKPLQAAHFHRMQLVIENDPPRQHIGPDGKSTAITGIFELTAPPLFNPAEYEHLREKGSVLAFSLPPGHYRISNFRLLWESGLGKRKEFSAPRPFSIPFTVQAGQAVYLGNYQLHSLRDAQFPGIAQPGGGLFVLSDRFDADVRIAQRKLPGLGSPVNQTPDASRLDNPALLTPAQGAQRLQADAR